MRAEIDQLLTVLNIKAEPKETTYSFNTEYVYKAERKTMYPRTKIFKFYKRKMVNKIFINNNVDAIKYITEELKLYN